MTPEFQFDFQQPKQKTNAGAYAALGFLLILVVSAIGAGYYYFVVRPGKVYVSETKTFGPYVREFKGAKVDVPVDAEILTPSLLKLYKNEGMGFKVTFVKKFKGKVDWERTVELKAWDVYEDSTSSREARGKELKAKRKALHDIVTALNSDDPRTWNALLFVDGTSGTGPYMANVVNQAIGGFNLPDLLGRGDIVILQARLLSSSGLAESKDVTLNKDDNLDDAMKPIKDWIFQPRADKGNSAIASALFGTLSELDNPYVMVEIVSDGVENTSTTADFYHMGPQLGQAKTDPKEFKAIWLALQRDKECPDLSGKEVFWYYYVAPPATDQIVFDAHELWKKGLQLKGAVVKGRGVQISFPKG